MCNRFLNTFITYYSFYFNSIVSFMLRPLRYILNISVGH